MRYVKDFTKVLILTEEGFSDVELRIVSGLSDRTIREYKDLIEIYSTEEYLGRLAQLRTMFRKKTTPGGTIRTTPTIDPRGQKR